MVLMEGEGEDPNYPVEWLRDRARGEVGMRGGLIEMG